MRYLRECPMRDLEPFALERYFAEHEFTVSHELSPSDCEPVSLRELLGSATGGATPGGRVPSAGPSRSPRTGSGPFSGLRSGDSTAWLERFLDQRLGYTESAGAPGLRERIATYYATIGPDEVLIAAPEELIFLFMNAVLEPGDHVVALSPAYQSLHALPTSLGADLTTWPVREDGEKWCLDLDEFRSLLRPETKLIVLNFPHNPTGLLPDRRTLEAIVEIARTAGLMLFSDEMYRGLEHGGKRLPAVCDLYENGVSLWGLSKSFGLPGLRIGWLATHNASLLGRAATLKDYTTICNSAPSEAIASLALEQGEKLMEANRSRVRENLGLVRRAFSGPEAPVELLAGGGEWEPAGDLGGGGLAGGGSTILPRFTDGRSSTAVAEELRAAWDTLLIPGPLFDMPDEYFRLGLGRTGFPEAFERFHRYLESI